MILSLEDIISHAEMNEIILPYGQLSRRGAGVEYAAARRRLYDRREALAVLWIGVREKCMLRAIASGMSPETCVVTDVLAKRAQQPIY